MKKITIITEETVAVFEDVPLKGWYLDGLWNEIMFLDNLVEFKVCRWLKDNGFVFQTMCHTDMYRNHPGWIKLFSPEGKTYEIRRYSDQKGIKIVNVTREIYYKEEEIW